MFNSLKKRVATALILIPLVVLALLYAHPLILAAMVLFVLAVGAWEWFALIPINKTWQKVVYGVLLILSLGACVVWFSVWIILSLVAWLAIILAILTYPRSEAIWGRPGVVGFLGLLLLPLAGCVLAALYENLYGVGLIVYVLGLVIAADSGAYFAGNLWGKHKLIPKVSAGKTIEGSIGGLLLPMLVAWAGALIWSPMSWFAWFGLALATTVMSMFGDLFISMLKRRSHVKDTGSLLPGHGGVLDRIDSLLAALPCFYIGFYYLPLGL
ncbi:MAG: phosphatidate cytidylyltransferase [Legionellaceae bacterium]|nr:phosphatidate cytidylyltransferase [Legionellaceae bacterium]